MQENSCVYGKILDVVELKSTTTGKDLFDAVKRTLTDFDLTTKDLKTEQNFKKSSNQHSRTNHTKQDVDYLKKH